MDAEDIEHTIFAICALLLILGIAYPFSVDQPTEQHNPRYEMVYYEVITPPHLPNETPVSYYIDNGGVRHNVTVYGNNRLYIQDVIRADD